MNVEAVEIDILSRVPMQVQLGRVTSMNPRDDHLADVQNLDLWIQENALAETLAPRIDAESIASAFQYGLREALSDGQPFRVVDEAPDTLQIDVNEWGVEAVTRFGPTLFFYGVRVLAADPDGRIFYRTQFKCYGDPGPVVGVDRAEDAQRRLEDVPDADIQRAFDKASHHCGHRLAERIRRHAGADAVEPR